MAPASRKKPFSLRFRAWLWRIRKLTTPLRLRGSISRLRRYHKRPILALIRLFIPYPTWKFPVSDPLSPVAILGNADLHGARTKDIINLQSIPVWAARDTPLRSLYRMYEAMASGVYTALGFETEYFWHQSGWMLESVPDPHDNDPIRYAIIACLIEELVVAFNWRMSLGLRRNRKNIVRETSEDPYPPYEPVMAPVWTKLVPAISATDLKRLSPEYVDKAKLVLENEGSNKIFARRNIITNVGWLYTI